ncbi:GAF domain-containing SpoIIE family protein phosphatase [Adhaeribacter aquaticus]|uniref:GAF domain-containing SpoIIE family protein phosphatase n=1 Tax=Adhaeribacter aquaticus TaxID=299567 RepID=UPI00042661F2|nr:GAF domain-containing SpoIIE family protein phosphatase [Adhaeribacter aquaticus]
MPNPVNFKKTFLFIAVLSWFLLLGNILLNHSQSQLSASLAGVSDYLNYILKAAFVIAIFMLQRISVNSIKGLDFIGYLWKLFTRAGITAYICIVLYLGYEVYTNYYTDTNLYLLEVIYTINFAFFIYFIAKAFYIWRRLILFQKTKALDFEWRWFEILLYSTILLSIFRLDYTSIIFIPLLALLALYVLFLSSHLKWVAYLTSGKRWRSIFLLLAILLSQGIFIWYFTETIPETSGIQLNYLDDPFILLAGMFVVTYTGISFLVAFFSLPTSSVFEQKRDDLLNFQRLTQLIQQGEDEQQVYKTLFDSAIKASNTDAAWLEILIDEGSEVIEVLNLEESNIVQIRNLVQSFIITNVDYINGNLDNNIHFKALQLPYKSIYVVPLKSPQLRTYGVLYLLKDIEQGYDRETVNVIRTFASQTILTIENLRLASEALQNERYKEELKIASSVQDSLIPKTFPRDTWFEISCFSQAAKEVGGDFYDFLQLSESRIAIIIGDVSGKGISAAFHMAQMKGIFHGLMQDDLEPVKFMVKANQALTHCLERTSFITSALYIIDYKMRGFFFARAGHCHTLYYNSMTEETFYFNTDGLGLGIIRDQSYGKRIHNMHYDYNPGDVMVIYTDGIVEARNIKQEEYGEDRLREMLAQTYHLNADDIKYAIINDVNDFSQDMPIHDDQTLIVIKFLNVQQN